MDYTFWLQIVGALTCFVLINSLLCGWARHSSRQFLAFNWIIEHKPMSYIFSLGHTDEEVEEMTNPPAINPDQQRIFWAVVMIAVESIGILIFASLFAPFTWPAIVWGIIVEPRAPSNKPVKTIP